MELQSIKDSVFQQRLAGDFCILVEDFNRYGWAVDFLLRQIDQPARAARR
jgi:hypothetical protein